MSIPIYPSESGASGHGLDIFQLEPVVALQAQFGTFNKASRDMPDFLLMTKRVDMANRKNKKFRGPFLYRLKKGISAREAPSGASRVSPLVSAIRTASLRNSSVRVSLIVHLLCCSKCYQRSRIKPQQVQTDLGKPLKDVANALQTLKGRKLDETVEQLYNAKVEASKLTEEVQRSWDQCLSEIEQARNQ